MLTIGPGVVQWVGEVLRCKYSDQAQGIGWKRDGAFTCGAVFEGYNGPNIYVHIAKVHGTIFPAAFIAAFVDYPFNRLGCRRMTAAIASHNTQSLAFARKLGARLEGILQEAAPEGDLHIFGLLRKDAMKWLSEPFQRRLGEFDGRSSNEHAGDGGRRWSARQATSAASA